MGLVVLDDMKPAICSSDILTAVLKSCCCQQAAGLMPLRATGIGSNCLVRVLPMGSLSLQYA